MDLTPRRKRRSYSPELKAEIVRYAIEHGNAKAVKFYAKTQDLHLNESTIRSFRSRCLQRSDGGKLVVTLNEKKRHIIVEFDTESQVYTATYHGKLARCLKAVFCVYTESVLSVWEIHVTQKVSYVFTFVSVCLYTG